MHVGCKCNVVIATCPQRYLESKFLRCHNVVITTLTQPKDNVVTTLSQRDFVCWDCWDIACLGGRSRKFGNSTSPPLMKIHGSPPDLNLTGQAVSTNEFVVHGAVHFFLACYIHHSQHPDVDKL